MTEYLTNDPNAPWPENIPEISTEDPVLGGANGPVNVPHQKLADRTAYLKRVLEAIEAELADYGPLTDHISDGAAHSAASAAEAGRIILRDGAGRAQVAPPAANADIANKSYVDDKVGAVAPADVTKQYVDSHISATSAHSATSAATANRMMIRDASGRVQAAAPSAAADVAIKSYVDSAVQSAGSSSHTHAWADVTGKPTILGAATNAQTQTGTITSAAVTPASLTSRTATTSRTGLVQLATASEVSTGTNNEKAVTPMLLKNLGFGGAILRMRVITSSGSLADPSGGKATLWRITLVGGGGAGGQASGRGAGGAGATVIRVFEKSELSWPINITIGAGAAAGSGSTAGSSSFGSHLTAPGGTSGSNTAANNGRGGFPTGHDNRTFAVKGQVGESGSTSSALGGSSYIVPLHGSGGGSTQAGGAGQAIYGGGGGATSVSDACKGADGVCLIEWTE